MLKIKSGTLRYIFPGMIVLCLVLAFLFLSADSQPQETGWNDYRWNESENATFVKKVEVLTPNNAPGYDIVCIAGTDSSTYYVLAKPLIGTNLAESTNIYTFTNGESQLLFSYETPETGHWVNELVSTNEYLYWVYSDSTEKSIIQYDINSNAVSIIKSFLPSDGEILLTGDSRFVTWFEYQENGPIALWALDSKTGEIHLISDRISPTQSAYTRAYVNNGVTSFVEGNNSLKIVVWDLNLKGAISEVEIDSSSIMNPQATANYLLWGEANPESSQPKLHFFNLETNANQTILLSDKDVRVFSFHLLNNRIILNDRMSASLLILNPDDLTKDSFQQNAKSHVYVLCAILNGDCVLTYDAANENILRIKL